VSLHATEQSTYADLWATVPHYGDCAPGVHYVPLFRECVSRFGHGPKFLGKPTVLDAGTGSGKGALELQQAGFAVTCCDITDAGLVADARALPFKAACLWHPLRPIAPRSGLFDFVYCTDVLEHIAPEFTMLTIAQMLAVARRGLFLSVSLVPDNFGIWAGKPLHQTVRDYRWWRDALREVGQVLDARDLETDATFYVRGR
jgi:SAM-dependent methyltransferase